MSASDERVIYLDPIDNGIVAKQSRMKFTLTYAGPLQATQQDRDKPSPLAKHKHDIRKEFHQQLKLLWNTNKFLRDHKIQKNIGDLTPAQQQQMVGMWALDPEKYPKVPMVEAIAENYHEYGFRFVPLVRNELSLLCSLDILFLRRDYPGSVISAGDIDNRIKTLIDALRRPRTGNELKYPEPDGSWKTLIPGPDEDPFFCLLEDDKDVTGLTVRTDNLLNLTLASEKITSKEEDQRRVLVVISVEIKPYDITMLNLSFA